MNTFGLRTQTKSLHLCVCQNYRYIWFRVNVTLCCLARARISCTSGALSECAMRGGAGARWLSVLRREARSSQYVNEWYASTSSQVGVSCTGIVSRISQELILRESYSFSGVCVVMKPCVLCCQASPRWDLFSDGGGQKPDLNGAAH
jgi:hypothetical protein